MHIILFCTICLRVCVCCCCVLAVCVHLSYLFLVSFRNKRLRPIVMSMSPALSHWICVCCAVCAAYVYICSRIECGIVYIVNGI